MIITICPRCGSMNVTTTCTKCGWSQLTKSTVSTGVYKTIGELEIKMSGKALLDDYKRLLFEIRSLTERIAELEEEQVILKDQQREAKNHLIDKRLHIDSLYEEGYKLQKRIAELEGKIDQLTAHSDIERQDDKSSNDTQTDTVVYGKDSD